jgi:membrane protein
VQPAWLRVGVSFIAAPILGVLLVLTLALFMITTRIPVFATQWFDLNEAVVGLWDWVRLPAGFVVAGVVIAAVYRFAPSQRQSFRAVMAGTFVASAVWVPHPWCSRARFRA